MSGGNVRHPMLKSHNCDGRQMENRPERILARVAVAALFCVVYALGSSALQDHRIVVAQYIQRISAEEKIPARREAQMFRQVTRAHDSAFRQAARRDVQLGRRAIWDYETRFRSERRRTVREKINRTRVQEQVIRTDRANFNLAQTKERQSLHATTAQQRREQTLRISRDIRRTNIERQRANRQRIEEVRETIRAELEQIREGTRPAAR